MFAVSRLVFAPFSVNAFDSRRDWFGLDYVKRCRNQSCHVTFVNSTNELWLWKCTCCTLPAWMTKLYTNIFAPHVSHRRYTRQSVYRTHCVNGPMIRKFHRTLEAKYGTAKKKLNESDECNRYRIHLILLQRKFPRMANMMLQWDRKRQRL